MKQRPESHDERDLLGEVHDGTSLELSLTKPRWEAFCRYLVVGNPEHDPEPARRHDPDNPPNTRHNATKSYVAAGYKARGHAAGANAHRLLKNADIQARITVLRDEAQRVDSIRMRPWRSLLVDAQRVLEKAMWGEEISAQAIQAARDVIRQAEGPAHLRFGAQSRQNQNEGLNITLWSGSCRHCSSAQDRASGVPSKRP